MRKSATVYGVFCLAASLFVVLDPAQAAVTQVQTASIAPTQPSWGPTTPALAGQNPLVFQKFDTRLGTLTAINLTMSYTSTHDVTMTFAGPATLTASTSALGAPNVGGNITLDGPSGAAGPNLLAVALPVLTWTKTAGTAGQTVVYSSSNSIASGLSLTPVGLPADPSSNNQSGTVLKTLSDSTNLSLFAGSGTINLPVFATNPTTHSATDQSSSSTLHTLDGVTVSLSYSYTAVPEPSSVALLGLGAGGLVMVRRFRRRPLAS